MAGLGLVSALNQYKEGVDWKRQQQQADIAKRRQDTIQQANAAGAAAIQASKDDDLAQQQKAWTDAGNDAGQFTPKPFVQSPPVLLNALHARADSLAQSGDLDLWTQNEAATAPVRNTIRQEVIGKALADYNATGDGAALAKTVYPTIHDGKDISDISVDPTGGLGMQGASQAANAGQAVKPAYKITLSNGQSHTMSGDQIAAMAHDVMMNPADAAKYEFESRILQAKNASQMAIDKAKATAEGDQARQTEGVKGQNAMKVEGLRSTTQLQVGAGNNAATTTSAGIRADAERDAAETSAGGRVEAARLRAGAGADGAKKVQRTGVDSNGYVINYFKDGTAARALDEKQQPILSSDYAKRVDSMMKVLGGQPGNMKKNPSDLRAMAVQALSGAPAPAPAASGLVPGPTPGKKLVYDPTTGGFQ